MLLTPVGVTAETGSAAVPDQPAPGGVLVADAFERTVDGGLGSDDQGGNWRVDGPSGAFAVRDGRARLTLAGPAAGLLAITAAAPTSALSARLAVALTAPSTGGGSYVWIGARRSGAGQYAARLHFRADHSVVMQITRQSGTQLVTLASSPVAGVDSRIGQQIMLATTLSGTTPTHMSAKAWVQGSPEPAAWTSSIVDTEPLTGAGEVAIGAYQSGTATSAQTVLLDDLSVGSPAITLVSGPAEGSLVAAAEASFTFSPDGVTAQCRLDAGAWDACASPVRWSGLTEGEHSLAVRAVDADGDAASELTRRWTVDTVAPTVTPIGPGATTSTSASVSFTSSEPAQSACSLDGAAFSACTSPWAVGPVGVGTHAVRIRARDAAGNTGPDAQASWTVTAPVPTTPPSPPAAPPPPPGGRPGPGNTGVPAGTKLTPYYGDLTITEAGARYDSLDIHGFVSIKAPNVTISRSIVRGSKGATGNTGLINNYDAGATNFQLVDSTLVPEFPSVYLDGMKGANFRLLRVDVSGVTDNVKVHGDNVSVEASWLHGSRSWTSDPYQGGGPTHNDAVQVLGGHNITVVDSTLQQADNAGIQVTQDYRATTDLRVTGNWIDGGGCSVNVNHKKLSSMAAITVSNNRFGTAQRNSGCAIISTKATQLSATDNVWDGTGQPVRISNGG